LRASNLAILQTEHTGTNPVGITYDARTNDVWVAVYTGEIALIKPELPATYHRTHGIRYFHGCYSLGDDQLWGVVREHKGADHTLAALKSIRAARPDGYRLFVILDNLSANKTPAIRRWARRENIELCLTPTNASWANPIEAHFGPLRTFVMGNSDHPNHPALARRLQAYLRWRNAHARHPDVLAAQRRERARIRSERQQRWGRPKPKAA